MFYLIQKLIYASGFRPKRWSRFYSPVLEQEERWRTGEK